MSIFDKAAENFYLEKLKPENSALRQNILTFENFIIICFTTAFQAISMLKRTTFLSKDRGVARTERRKLNASVKNN